MTDPESDMPIHQRTQQCTSEFSRRRLQRVSKPSDADPTDMFSCVQSKHNRVLKLVQTIGLVICALLVCATAAVPRVWAKSDVEIPIELKPYRTSVLVAFNDDASFTRQFRKRTLARLQERCDSFWGRMCDVQIRENLRLYPATTTTLKRITATGISVDEEKFDKTFVLTLQSAGGGYLVAGRSWETSSREMSELVSVDFYRRDEVAGYLFDLLSELFEPIVAIGDFDSKTVSVTVRAGEILPADPGQAQLPPGRMLQPFYRFLTKENKVQRIQVIPWTYFTVIESNRAVATCRLVSGLRVPLTTRRRRLIHAMAKGIQPRFDGTRLKLESQRVSGQPLIGCTVHLLSPNEETKPLRLISGLDGTVVIPASSGELPMTLTVHSGRALLAKLPIIPGLVKESVIGLPDDTTRLSVEGELSVLETEIIDAVASRAVMMARARHNIKNNEWDKVDEQLVLIDRLSGPGQFQTRLTIIRERGMERANANKERSAGKRIERLCERTEELIDRYLKLDKVKEFKEELTELREELKGEDQ